MLRCFRDGISCRLITHFVTEERKKREKYGEKGAIERRKEKKREGDQRIKKCSEERETIKKEVQREEQGIN